MKFRLSVSLDNAEAADMGAHRAALTYLNVASVSLEAADSDRIEGPVRDGNGNLIGRWEFLNSDLDDMTI